jgi:hypothetical protein
MKLFILKVMGDNTKYEEQVEVVVRATNEDEARKFASSTNADGAWRFDSEKHTTCEELRYRGTKGVIISAYNG